MEAARALASASESAGKGTTCASCRITFRDGEPAVADGPFSETTELIAGFTIIEVKAREEALEWAMRWPEPNAVIELRQLFVAEDFGDEFTGELQAKEAELRAATGSRF